MDVNFSLFSINVPDWLILRARRTDAPGAEVARTSLGPAPAGTLNFLMTGLALVNHFFDLYESVDGTQLNQLLGTFTYDVRNQRITDETRYYVVDSGVNNSPAAGDTTITDSYLSDKTVTRFEKRSIGPLVPDGLLLNSEWSISGDVITLLGDMPAFSSQETYTAYITYLTDVPDPGQAGFFKGIKTVTASLTMDATYRNNRVKCVAAGNQLVVTFEHIGAIPAGTFWYFTDQDGGAQYQTKFAVQDGNLLFNGVSYNELWIGKGESLWIEFNSGMFEVIKECKGLLDVGTRSAETFNIFPNMLPEDGGLYLADDYPRIWYWITHAYPNGSYYITDNNLDNAGYTRPVDVNGFTYKAGLFIISTTKRKFRMPDTRGYSERGMKSFDTFGSDATRLYDWPGGWQPQAVLDHIHNAHAGGPIVGGAGSLYLHTDGLGTVPHAFSGNGSANLGGSTTVDQNFTTGPAKKLDNSGTIGNAENRVNNFGVIYMRHV